MPNIVDRFDVEGGPGRPRILKRPSRRTRDRVERYQAALAAHEEEDVLLQVARRRDSIEPLYVVRHQAALEAASLMWERLHARPGSREIGRISSRRVAALTEIGNLTMAIARADPDAPTAATIRRVCDLLIADVKRAAAEVLPAETVRNFSAALSRRLTDVELDAVIAT